MSTNKQGRGKQTKGAESKGNKPEQEQEIVPCGECKDEVLSEGLQCEVCERWYHSGCQGMTPETYLVMNQECIHWFCRYCDKRVSKLVKTVARLEERQDRMEGELVETKEEVRMVKEEVKRLDTKISNISQPIGPDSATSSVIKREDVLEEIEIERKKMNIVINGLKENNTDEEEVKDVLTKLAGAKGARSIMNIERIGKKTSDKKKIRPIRVVLNNTESKYEILKQAPTLRNIEEFKKLYVSPDLTRKQLEADKLLQTKLKEIREAGESEAKIKKGRVVKNSNGTEVVLYPPLQN